MRRQTIWPLSGRVGLAAHHERSVHRRRP